MNDPRAQYRANHDKAKAAGERFYDGAPCKVHHVSKRYVTSFSCVECRRKQRRNEGDRAYSKDYTPKSLGTWPEAAFENVTTYDHIGSAYLRTHSHGLPYASVMANVGEG